MYVYYFVKMSKTFICTCIFYIDLKYRYIFFLYINICFAFNMCLNAEVDCAIRAWAQIGGDLEGLIWGRHFYMEISE